MFASARTAAAGSPLASPSLKRIVEFTHAHTHAHTRSPLVGLGITGLNMPGQGVSDAASSSAMHAGHGSRQPKVLRPRIRRMQTQDVNVPVPCTPRLQCTPVFPSVFSPITHSPTGAQSPFVPEGYGSDDNVSSELREALASSNRFMNTHTSGRPKVPRPRTPYLQNLDSNMSMPRTPRLQSTPVLPPVFSHFTSAQTPDLERDGPDDNASSELRELMASGSRFMNTDATAQDRFAAATNSIRSTVHPTIQNIHPEVERIGLGISGIMLNQGTVSNVNANPVDILPSRRELASEGRYMNTATITPNALRKVSCRERVSRAQSRLIRFNSREQVITSIIESDGYAADTEREDGLGPHRRNRNRQNLALCGFRSCKGRLVTPYYAPNGRSSWL